MNSMIRILADSTSDLSQDVKDSLGIETIPMMIQVDAQVYREGANIDPQTLFDQVRQTGVYPTAAALSPFFKSCPAEG
jgi:fatty acid-binding protein DegV